MSATLDTLPTEILFIIGRILLTDDIFKQRTQNTYAALALTNRRLHDVFNPILWQFNKDYGVHDIDPVVVLSAVSWAASRNRIDILEKAIEFEHSLGSFLEIDPIHRATEKGHDATVSWLLDHGVPLECTPCEVVDVDSPFPVSPWPENHVSPIYAALYTALKFGQQSTVNLLLSRGAKHQFVAEINFSALHYAAHNRQFAVVEYMIKTMGIDVDLEDQTGMTPLHYAAGQRHNEKVTQLLIDLGAEISPARFIQTPLIVALQKGNFGDAMVLLDAGADVNPTRENQDSSPLVECASGTFTFDESPEKLTQYQVLRKLIANGASLNKSFNKKTALCAAVEHGTTLAVFELLKAGADIQTPRELDGLMPFDLVWRIERNEEALEDRSYSIIEEVTDKISLLLAAGARIDTRHLNSNTGLFDNSQLENAIDYCLKGESLPLHHLLGLATARNVRDSYVDELFEKCMADKQLEPARIMMHHGATCDATNGLAFKWAKEIVERDDGSGADNDAFTFCLRLLTVQQIEELFHLYLECAWNQDRGQILIDHGALSSLKKTKTFKPWLHLAASRGDKSLIRRLLRAGMDINALDEEFRTPMMAGLRDDNNWELANGLFELGANPFIPFPEAECRQLPNKSSTEIISPFELAIRENNLWEMQKWWFKTPPESRPKGKFSIPCVLARGPWHQNYVKHLRDPSDDSVSSETIDEYTTFEDIGWTRQCDLRTLDEEEEKKTRLIFTMESVVMRPCADEHAFSDHIWS